jgi:hypothetical protein
MAVILRRSGLLIMPMSCDALLPEQQSASY